MQYTPWGKEKHSLIETAGKESDLLEMFGCAQVPLAKERVSVLVDAELLRTMPNHPELFDAGRYQTRGGIQGEDDQYTCQKEAKEWNKKNGLH